MLKRTLAQAGQMRPSHCKTEAASGIQSTKAALQAGFLFNVSEKMRLTLHVCYVLLGSVTMEDILSVLPFQTGVIFMKIKGEYLLQALEESVRFYDFTGMEAPGRFLQYSGIYYSKIA
jgi:2',3'-cyclic-nucleotide 2'-phosphodiesterase (5'-nucleotidase family)